MSTWVGIVLYLRIYGYVSGRLSWQKNKLHRTGCKKRGLCYSKSEEAAWPCFLQLIFSPFFLGHKPTPVFKIKIVGVELLGVRSFMSGNSIAASSNFKR